MTTPVETIVLSINTTTDVVSGSFDMKAGLNYQVQIVFSGSNIPDNSQTVELAGDATAGRISLISLAVTNNEYADGVLVADADANTALFYRQTANPGTELKTIPYYLQVKVDGVIRWQILGTATGSMVKGVTIAQPPFDFTAAVNNAKLYRDEAQDFAMEADASALEAQLAAQEANSASASALTYSQNAQASAEDAAADATIAYDYAHDAQSYASAASNAANTAMDEANAAAGFAAQAESFRNTAGQYASSASTSSASAQSSAESAFASKQEAEEWADFSRVYAEAAYISAQNAKHSEEVISDITLNTVAPLTGGGNLIDDLTVSMSQSSSSSDGWLSSSDWNEFNGKQDALEFPNNSAKYLDGTGNWTIPSGGGGGGVESFMARAG